LHTTFGALVAWWRWLICVFILIILICGYAGNLLLAFIFLWIAAGFEHLSWGPLTSAMLVPAGRPERFRAVILLSTVVTGILLLSIVAMTVLSTPLSWRIPEFEVWSQPVVYHRVSLINVWVPLLFVPLLGIPHVLAPKRWWSTMDLALPLAAPLIPIVGAIALAWTSLRFGGVVLFDLVVKNPAACLTGAIVLTWLLFGLACYYKTRTRSLAGQ